MFKCVGCVSMIGMGSGSILCCLTMSVAWWCCNFMQHVGFVC